MEKGAFNKPNEFTARFIDKKLERTNFIDVGRGSGTLAKRYGCRDSDQAIDQLAQTQ
jgi:hypothetical protein